MHTNYANKQYKYSYYLDSWFLSYMYAIQLTNADCPIGRRHRSSWHVVGNNFSRAVQSLSESLTEEEVEKEEEADGLRLIVGGRLYRRSSSGPTVSDHAATRRRRPLSADDQQPLVEQRTRSTLLLADNHATVDSGGGLAVGYGSSSIRLHDNDNNVEPMHKDDRGTENVTGRARQTGEQFAVNSSIDSVAGDKNVFVVRIESGALRFENTTLPESNGTLHQTLVESNETLHHTLAESNGTLYPTLQESSGTLHPTVLERSGTLHTFPVESNQTLHSTIAERNGTLHPTPGESSGTLHPTLAESSGTLHPTPAESSGTLHPTVPESNGTLHPTLAESNGTLHPTLAESSRTLHPTLAESSGTLHPTPAESNVTPGARFRQPRLASYDPEVMMLIRGALLTEDAAEADSQLIREAADKDGGQTAERSEVRRLARSEAVEEEPEVESCLHNWVE